MTGSTTDEQALMWAGLGGRPGLSGMGRSGKASLKPWPLGNEQPAPRAWRAGRSMRHLLEGETEGGAAMWEEV